MMLLNVLHERMVVPWLAVRVDVCGVADGGGRRYRQLVVLLQLLYLLALLNLLRLLLELL